MARIPYGQYTRAIQDVILNDASIIKYGVTVDIGRPPTLGLGMMPHIGIYEGSRFPSPGQTIAAGTRIRYNLNWNVWVAIFSGAGYADALDQRDEILGVLEITMMKNRDLGGLLPNKPLNLGGGDLRSGPGSGGFIAEGSLSLSLEVEGSSS